MSQNFRRCGWGTKTPSRALPWQSIDEDSDLPVQGSWVRPLVRELDPTCCAVRPKMYIHACVLSRFSRLRLFATPGTVARQAPLSMGFSQQVYWSRLPALLQVIFPTQGSNPNLISPALAVRFFTTSATWEAPVLCIPMAFRKWHYDGKNHR